MVVVVDGPCLIYIYSADTVNEKVNSYSAFEWTIYFYLLTLIEFKDYILQFFNSLMKRNP